MGRHAYIMTANGNFSVLKACLRLIDDKRNDIFILFDEKAKVSNAVRESILDEVKQSHIDILCDQIVNWGRLSENSSMTHKTP